MYWTYEGGRVLELLCDVWEKEKNFSLLPGIEQGFIGRAAFGPINILTELRKILAEGTKD